MSTRERSVSGKGETTQGNAWEAQSPTQVGVCLGYVRQGLVTRQGQGLSHHPARQACLGLRLGLQGKGLGTVEGITNPFDPCPGVKNNNKGGVGAVQLGHQRGKGQWGQGCWELNGACPPRSGEAGEWAGQGLSHCHWGWGPRGKAGVSPPVLPVISGGGRSQASQLGLGKLLGRRLFLSTIWEPCLGTNWEAGVSETVWATQAGVSQVQGRQLQAGTTRQCSLLPGPTWEV